MNPRPLAPKASALPSCATPRRRQSSPSPWRRTRTPSWSDGARVVGVERGASRVVGGCLRQGAATVVRYETTRSGLRSARPDLTIGNRPPRDHIVRRTTAVGIRPVRHVSNPIARTAARLVRMRVIAAWGDVWDRAVIASFFWLVCGGAYTLCIGSIWSSVPVPRGVVPLPVRDLCHRAHARSLAGGRGLTSRTQIALRDVTGWTIGLPPS